MLSTSIARHAVNRSSSSCTRSVHWRSRRGPMPRRTTGVHSVHCAEHGQRDAGARARARARVAGTYERISANMRDSGGLCAADPANADARELAELTRSDVVEILIREKFNGISSWSRSMARDGTPAAETAGALAFAAESCHGLGGKPSLTSGQARPIGASTGELVGSGASRSAHGGCERSVACRRTSPSDTLGRLTTAACSARFKSWGKFNNAPTGRLCSEGAHSWRQVEQGQPCSPWGRSGDRPRRSPHQHGATHSRRATASHRASVQGLHLVTAARPITRGWTSRRPT